MLMLLQGVTHIYCIKVLLNLILESTSSLTECYHYGIVCLMVLWSLIPLSVLKVDYALWEADFTGTAKSGTEVYVYYNVLFKFAKFNRDENTDIETLTRNNLA